MNVKLLKPYGFCAGVSNVVKVVKEIAKKHKEEKIYCIGQVVHNKIVNDELTSLGVTMLSGDKENIVDSIKEGVVIFSAHGTNEMILQKAKDKGLIVYDTVCPFVKRELGIMKDKLDNGYDVIYIGVSGHDETTTALSLSKDIHFITCIQDVSKLNISNKKIVAINQTTLSMDDLKEIYKEICNKYPNAEIVEEICSSTRLRQQAISNILDDFDGVIIVGDKTSNNTKSLKNISIKKGHDTILVDNYEAIDLDWLKGKKNVLVASGTSTPNQIVEEVYEKLKNL